MLTIPSKTTLRAFTVVTVCVLLYAAVSTHDSIGALGPAGRPDGFPSAVGFGSAMFLSISGIRGESVDHHHTDWIEIVSLDTGVARPVLDMSGESRMASGPQFSEITVGKVIDKATPYLHLYCCEGKYIDEVVIELCRPAGEKQVYMKYTLRDVIISGVVPVTVTPEDQLEQVSFRFAQIRWEYTPVERDGRPGAVIETGWNLPENKRI